jgi:PiT family inorganic phosphate transporter
MMAKALDRDLKAISRIEKAAGGSGRGALNLGLGFIFLLFVLGFVAIQVGGFEGSALVIAAGVIGGYMALNIGANDVANNVGPAVGSKALTIVGALIIAVIFESAGALLAGGDVVKTISKGIIDPNLIADTDVFIWAMMAALLAAAAWINIATWVGAPVSTTHSIVGGVLGAGIAAAGVSVVNWPTMATIAASWVISPVLGGLIAAAFLAAMKFLIVFKDDKIAAAKRWVPVFVAIMASAFSIYLIMKGFKRIYQADVGTIAAIGIAALIITYLLVRPAIARMAEGLENRRRSVSTLFTIPLICAAAMLSFAHGANDVANAIGPLAAIVSAVGDGGIEARVVVPPWVMVVGALGIAAGLALYGPKLIRTVGEKITKLDRMRAFAVALAAAITVIIASALGLPVSSTHIAVGAIFGVGFFREILVNWNKGANAERDMVGGETGKTKTGVRDIAAAAAAGMAVTKKDTKKLKKARKRRLVRRYYVVTIVAAWILTVPAAAFLSAFFFFALRGLLLP